ncbi:MAG: calcineurin-like phosphoesterase family protein [Planctomycetota bacterium]
MSAGSHDHESHAATATGVVFHDANSNGTIDPGDQGIPGVLVSNGRDVVKTDPLGRYRIDIDHDDIVFVIEPAGYDTPRDEHNIPRFYYIHKPGGSPDADFIFPGVAPTGDLPTWIDFPLTKSREAREFDVLLFGDPQAYSVEQMMFYTDEILQPLRSSGAAFAVSLGDLVGDDLDLFEPLNAAQSVLGIPVRNVYGNHDMNFLSPNDEFADETFERVYGPPNYAFQHGRAHFIILDNVYYNGFHGFDEDMTPWDGFARADERGFPNRRNYKGHLRPDQIEFILNYLAHVDKDDLIVFAAHIPFASNDPESIHRVPELAELLRHISQFPNTLSLSGHTHVNQHFFLGSDAGYINDRVPFHHHYNVGTTSGSWYRGVRDVEGVPHGLMRDGTPRGYGVLTVKGNQYAVRFESIYAGVNKDMRIITPREIELGELEPNMTLLANIWGTTGHQSRVRARVISNGTPGPWRQMTHAPQPDPFYAEVASAERENRPEGIRPSPNPQISHNMFEAQISVPRAHGLHLFEIEATDMSGRTVTGRRAMHVTEPGSQQN